MPGRVLLAGAAAILLAIALVSGWLFVRGSGPPSGAASLHGTITRITPAGDGGVVLVEEKPGEAGGSAKASVTISSRARILMHRASGYTAGRFGDLAAGQLVDVWFDGLVMTSYPLQAKASAIVVH